MRGSEGGEERREQKEGWREERGERERSPVQSTPTQPHSTPPMPYFLIHDFKYMNLWEAFLFSPPVLAALSKVRTIFHTQCSVVA